jgi:hypothetical protein
MDMAAKCADARLNARKRDYGLLLSIHPTALGYSVGNAQIARMLVLADPRELAPLSPDQAVQQQSHPEDEEEHEPREEARCHHGGD